MSDASVSSKTRRPSSVARLSDAIAVETTTPELLDGSRLPGHDAFLAFLATAFPRLHEHRLDVDLDGFGRIYRIPASSGSTENGGAGDRRYAKGGPAEGGPTPRLPVLFLAHYDVVPPGAKSEWSYPPFSGDVSEDFVWGRGALDDKGVLMALCESAESLLLSGRRPYRDLYLAFGGDEERSGQLGAARISKFLSDSGVRFAAVFDEGSTIVEGMLAFIDRPLALIGTAEKGYADVVLRSSGDQGHASMPPRRTAVGNLARAIVRMESKRFPSRRTPGVEGFLRALGRTKGGALGLVLRHPRLFWPVVERAIGSTAPGDALLRTTQAFTMARGSSAPAVLPKTAEAVANVRILPGESVRSVLARYSAVGRRFGITAAPLPGSMPGEPTATSSTDSAEYAALVSAITGEYPEAVPAPFLVTVTTDSKHYEGIAEAIYRFVPLRLNADTLTRIHGTDERIRVADYLRMIRFYERLFDRLCGSNTAADEAGAGQAERRERGRN